MTLIVLIISFLLDGILSNFIGINSLFYPLFSLVSFIIIFPYFNNEFDFYKSSFILGILYDLIYTDTFIFYGVVFLMISFIISKVSSIINDNCISLIIITIITITLFRSISYLFIVLTGNMPFSFDILFKSVYSSLIINIIYTLILKMLMDKLDSVFRFRKGLRY